MAEPAASSGPTGLFVGLCTLDVVQRVPRVPGPDEKLTSDAQTVAAGGPAANAAVAFAHLGGTARLLTAIGAHPLGRAAAEDLRAHGVTVTDLAPERAEPPAVSSILVTAATGERSVASTNARGVALAPPADLPALVAAADVVEVDGHHMPLALAAVRAARERGRTTLLDGGSWKDGTEDLLPYVDVAVCSSAFRPPGTAGPEETLEYLRVRGVGRAAVTRGPEPVLWRGADGGGAVAVPPVPVVDTLGAGDVLHGALAHALAVRAVAGGEPAGEAFAADLGEAVRVASLACGSFGTRAWLRRTGERQRIPGPAR